MKHAREDYDRIQDPDGKIPENEPVFLLRGQDKTAPAVLRMWAELNKLIDGDETLIRAAEIQAERMENWQMSNGSKIADR